MIAADPRRAAWLALALAAACAGPSVSRRAPSRAEGAGLALQEARVALARGETLDGRRVPLECSGFVRALFLSSGIDLFAAAHEGDNGVRAIARYVERRGRWEAAPRAGDLAFFDNSYDRNGDGRFNDRLTHIGLVAEVEGDGTALIVHATNHGIVREPMNLLHPHQSTDAAGRQINAQLRRSSSRDPAGTPRLMGELFAGFGRVVER